MVAIDDPKTWQLDLLPLKRVHKGEIWPELGLLLPNAGPVVYLLNAFEPGLTSRLKKCETIAYRSFQALAEDGWVVD